MPLFTSVGFLGLVSNVLGLGLVILVLILVLRIWSCLHHCQTTSWWGLLPPPKNTTPLSAFGLDFRPFRPDSAASSNSLHFPQCTGVLINTDRAHFRSHRMHQDAGFFIKIYKNSWGRDPRTPAAEGDTFVRTHPDAHLPDAGAPPLLLGWLRSCRLVNSALFF